MLTERKRVSQPMFSERRRGSILVGQRSIDLMALNQQGGADSGPRFVKFIIRQYKRWGYLISDHAWKAIIICSIISLLGLVQVLRTPQRNDITGYTPYGARAIEEYEKYQEFFSEKGLGVVVYLFALAKDGGTMLREPYLKETIEILDEALDNVNLTNAKGEPKPFSKFCHSFCEINEPVRHFYNGLRVQNDLAKKKQKLNGRMILRYPITNLFGLSFSLQQNFFGLEFYDHAEQDKAEELLHKHVKDDGNDTGIPAESLQSHISNMKMVKMVVLQLRAEHDPTWTDEHVKEYEMAMVKRFQEGYKSKRLDLYVLTQTYIEQEMVRAGISLVPYLTVGFFIMLCCSVVSVVGRSLYMHQHSLPKILLAVAACILPFMSCATALGILFTFGMRFSSILCVIPFLVLAIGVDSSFLMIHEWQRVNKHCRDHPSRKSMYVGYRVAELLSEVGPAILISALTNVFADSVGSFTSSREITLLCVGNLTSMIVAYCYQMSFYVGLFSIVGRYEISIEKRERTAFEASLRTAKYDRKQHLTRQASKFHDNTKQYISQSMQAYVNFVANKLVALGTIFVYLLYLGFSIYGITQININLTTQKLFPMDSPLITLDKLRVDYQVPHFTMATVFVNNPGNLSHPDRLATLDSFVDEMEHIHGSWGPVGTQYFVRKYRSFLSSFEDLDVDLTDNDDEETEEGGASTTSKPSTNALSFRGEDLKSFLDWPESSFWSGYIRLKNNSRHDLKKFFFTTAYHGEEIKVWTKRGELLNKWRETVDKYADEFDASVFHEDGVFLDLIENMPSDTWQSVVGTLLCMGAVCFLFLNSVFTVVIATTCVLSICVGILGSLSMWNVDLDPISMAAMIISVGCSVDIPAHVSYHYYTASSRENPDGETSPEYKLAHCLSSVAFPAVQAGISTVLCVCSLLFVHLYMSDVFVKVMFLTIALCLIHGLIFLPAFLIVFDTLFERCKSHANKLMPKNMINEKKAPVGLQKISNGKKNGHKRNGVAPNNDDKNTDRPAISSSPETSPKPEARKVLQPADAHNQRTPEPTKNQFDESKMTNINLDDPTPTIGHRVHYKDPDQTVITMANEAGVPEKKEDSKTKPTFDRQDSAPERRALYAQKQPTFNESNEPAT